MLQCCKHGSQYLCVVRGGEIQLHFWVCGLYQLLRRDLLFNDGRVECGSL